MWVSRKHYGDLLNAAVSNSKEVEAAMAALREELAELRSDLRVKEAENRLLTERCAQAETSMKWAMARVNTLEAERAQLISKVTDIPMPAPQLSVEPQQPTMERNIFSHDESGYVPPGDDDMSLSGLSEILGKPPDNFKDLGEVGFPAEE